MAGTVTTTEVMFDVIKKVTFDWESSSSGAADGTTTNYFTGEVIRMITDPGTAAPTADYDIVVNDADGYDILHGAGADRHTSNTEQVLSGTGVLGSCVATRLTLAVTNAGDTKAGTLILYLR
jgi:hypothetical protein